MPLHWRWPICSRWTYPARSRIIRAWMPGDDRRLTPCAAARTLAGGLLALAQGDPEGALKIADRLIESAPHTQEAQPIPGALNLKGDALMALGRMCGSAVRARTGARGGGSAQNTHLVVAHLCVSRPPVCQEQTARPSGGQGRTGTRMHQPDSGAY